MDNAPSLDPITDSVDSSKGNQVPIEALSPKSAKIRRLETETSKLKNENKKLKNRSKSESFQLKQLKEQLDDAKSEMTKANELAIQAKAQLSTEKKKFAEK